MRLGATAQSEWIKFRSVRSAPAVLLATGATLLLGAWLVCAGYRSGWAGMSAADRASFDPVYASLRGIELAQLFTGALGVLTVTGEYTSGQIRTTFAATPQRVQVVALKALVFGAVVWSWSTVLAFAAFFLGQGRLSAPATHAALGDAGVPTAVFGAGLYLAATGLLGLFLGVLLRRTSAALAALFGVLLILPVAASMLPGSLGDRIGEYLPSNAGEEIWMLNHDGPYALGAWPGFAVLAGCVAAVAAAAIVLIRRKDA
ncbi:hypothetical protein FHX73_12610 [Kitasatospora viridis]|uniref:ABC-2 family transporter n=2 Tax=Kitasatospora viridis TaxID=281105 RepID=A0A561TWJ7_9ACTN|nr:hypothetical protein FHX73_12610 [Kitasatospora viridis]